MKRVWRVSVFSVNLRTKSGGEQVVDIGKTALDGQMKKAGAAECGVRLTIKVLAEVLCNKAWMCVGGLIKLKAGTHSPVCGEMGKRVGWLAGSEPNLVQRLKRNSTTPGNHSSGKICSRTFGNLSKRDEKRAELRMKTQIWWACVDEKKTNTLAAKTMTRSVYKKNIQINALYAKCTAFE